MKGRYAHRDSSQTSHVFDSKSYLNIHIYISQVKHVGDNVKVIVSFV